MPKSVLFAAQADQKISPNVRMFCDSTQDAAQGPMPDTFIRQPAAAFVFERDDSIDIGVSGQNLWSEMIRDVTRNGRRTIDR